MAQPEQYLWESPAGDVAVYLAFEALDILNAAITEAGAAAPVRDAEVGGLLLGTAKRDTQLVLQIERIELLPSRYPRGPSFHLDPQDAPDMKRSEIVGYFRSHTRKDLFLSGYDQALIAEHFSGPDKIFLLVKPFKTRANLGGFFYSKHGEIAGLASPREFPFDRRELGGGEYEKIDPPNRPDHETSISRPPHKRQALLMWAGLAFLGLTGTGSLAYLLNETKPIPSKLRAFSAPVFASFALTASEGEREVTLKWNWQSAAVQSATKAVVDIQEGTFQKALTLDSEQLRHGSIVYSRPLAIADAVAFKMKLFFDGKTSISESVQLVSSRQIGPNVPALPAPGLWLAPEPKPAQAKSPTVSAITGAPAEIAEPEVPLLVRPALRRIP